MGCPDPGKRDRLGTPGSPANSLSSASLPSVPEVRNLWRPLLVPLAMAAPVRRPQFLLPWIAACTLVLGAGLYLLTAAHSPRKPDGAAAGEARTPPAPLVGPELPAVPSPEGILDPEATTGDPLLVDADPQRPGFQPGKELLDGVAAGGDPRLAGVAAGDSPRREAAEAEASSPVGSSRVPRRPSLQRSPLLADSSGAGMEQLLPPFGGALRVSWSGGLDGSGEDPEANALGQPEEFVLLRVGDDAFRAILLLDDAKAPPSGGELRGEDPESDPGGQSDPGAGSSGEPGEDPHGTGEDPPQSRRVWARWVASHLPGRSDWSPDSREELRDRLAGVLGERKSRYLVAATRELDAREAARLLDHLRRWMAERRS